jgi:hypothetical protein
MSAHYHALRQLKKNDTFKSGDVLVLFGELFNRGYANGLVEEAERRGMTIVRSTVGRREKDGVLRPLTAEEAAGIPQPFINIPLEAGFDLEPSNKGISPVDQLKDVRLSDWESFQLDRESALQSQKNGQNRFRNQIKNYLAELEKLIPAGANVLFAHLMAGGVPRTKIVMPLMNRAFKGTGDRWLPSEKFWNSEIGQLCSLSFNEVTANTFDFLIQESTALREKLQARGSKVAYLAYGYHGTEVLIDNNYTWQTYSPYIQGWAKMLLENYAQSWSKKGVTCTVYNCPEILTNSSSIFQGVEVSLYPLVGALKKESGNSHKSLDTLGRCQHVLKPEYTLEEVSAFTSNYLKNSLIREHCDFQKWPQHSSQKQMELMLESSDHLISMHKDNKVLLTHILSEVVFAGCGKVMLNDIAHPESPVSWINHDILAKVHSERAQ